MPTFFWVPDFEAHPKKSPARCGANAQGALAAFAVTSFLTESRQVLLSYQLPVVQRLNPFVFGGLPTSNYPERLH